MNERNAIAAYASETSTGWTACDKQGCTWPVDAKTAGRIEADREERFAKKRGTQ